MQIIIDTDKDGYEEIKKAIRMLQAYTGESQGSSYSNDPAPEASPGMFNIFNTDDASRSEPSDSDTSDSYPKTEILDEEKKPDPDARVELY